MKQKRIPAERKQNSTTATVGDVSLAVAVCIREE